MKNVFTPISILCLSFLFCRSATAQVLTDDALIRSGSYAGTAMSASGDVSLAAKEAPAYSSYSRNFLVRFDLSGLSSVTSAKLRLYLNYNNEVIDDTLRCSLVSSSWSENTVTWNGIEQGILSDSTIVQAGDLGKWFELDVTSAVNGALSAGVVSFRMSKATVSSYVWGFDSKETGEDLDNLHPPELIVVQSAGGTNAAPPVVPVTYSLAASDLSNQTGNVLSGVVDPDGDTVTVLSINGGTVGSALSGSYGDLTLNGDGSYSYVLDAALTTLAVGSSVVDSFSAVATDSQGNDVSFTVSFDILGENAPPVLIQAIVSQDATEGSPFSFQIPATTFSDPDTLTWTVTGAPAWIDTIQNNNSSTAPTLSGTPSVGDIGGTVTVSVSDNVNAPVSTSFGITVTSPGGPVGASSPLGLTSSAAPLGSTIDLEDEELVFENREAAGVSFKTGGSKVFVISNDGNVGIGAEALNPTEALEVDGTVKAKRVVVDSDWSDFVFYPGYVLPTLVDVEEHIAVHGHLPGVPSESDVRANGVSVGESQALLLQKIEELTLYMIEQQRMIQQLSQRVERQSEQIEKLRGE